MPRLITGPVRICGAIGNLAAGPWRRTRYLLDPPPVVADLARTADEVVLGQRLDRDPAARSWQRTALSGRIELPTGAEPARDGDALTALEHALDRHGVRILRSCSGEYCLTHLTPGADTLYLYRGLTTSRGLYYRRYRGGLVFSTDPEDLCDPHRTLYRQLDADVLTALALEAPLPDDACWYRDVHRLPAGHLLTVDAHGLHVHRHDDVRVAAPTRMPFADAARTFRELCSAAVDRATTDTPTIGIELSGGLDSAIVALEAHHHGHGALHPFHFHYDLPAMADERAMADAVAERCGLRLDPIDGTATLGPGGEYLLGGLPLRAPVTHGYVLPYLASCDALAARPGPRRFLSGVGGDELQVSDFITPLRIFGWGALNPLRAGAPPWHLFDNDMLRQLLGRPLDEPEPTRRAALLRAARTLLGTAPPRVSAMQPSLLDEVPWFTADATNAARTVVASALRDYAEGFARARDGIRRTWHEMLATYVAFHRSVNDYHKNAWQYAVFDDKGIDYAAPLLDRDLVEFCLTLTTRYRETVHRGHKVSKALMRAAYTGCLPRALLGRLAKVDYGLVPETCVLNNKPLLAELLGPSCRLAELGILAPGALRQALNQPTWQLRRVAAELVQTALLELWIRGCDRRPHHPLPAIDAPARAARPPDTPRTARRSTPPAAVPAPNGNGTWRLAPSTLVRFLPDEAVLLNQIRFTVYRLDATSADLLTLILRCGTWHRLEAELLRGEPTPPRARLHSARRFIDSLIAAGLLTGPQTPNPTMST
jgi:asparagine synthase (glutamine-hydrolysing)